MLQIWAPKKVSHIREVGTQLLVLNNIIVNATVNVHKCQVYLSVIGLVLPLKCPTSANGCGLHTFQMLKGWVY